MTTHMQLAGGSAVAPEVNRATRSDLARLTDAAAAGDELAWAGLVHRFDRLLRSVARSYGLGAADVEDAVQNTWLKAWCHLDQLRDPGAIGSWLVAMLRRDALRTLQRGVREVLTDTPPEGCEPQSPSAEQTLIDRECETSVRDAVDRLSGRQHQVISCLMASPRPSYEEISARLEMPIGSIGPTRLRAIEQLRGDHELRELAVA